MTPAGGAMTHVQREDTASVGSWDLSDEREFIENLLCQRFDFLLVFYSLVVAGAFSTDNALNFNLVFTAGAFICVLLAVSIMRTHNKLEMVLSWISNGAPNHASAQTDDWGTGSCTRALAMGLGVARRRDRKTPGRFLDSRPMCSVVVRGGAVWLAWIPDAVIAKPHCSRIGSPRRWTFPTGRGYRLWQKQMS